MTKSRDRKMFRTETDFVRWLAGIARAADARVRLGIGDDAALVRIGENRDLVLTTDLSIEGVHFREKIHPPRAVGHRALARALSDIAAMGAAPRFALVSLAISSRTTRQWLKEFYAGMRLLARRSGVSIIGGDTAVVPGRVAVDVTALGEAVRGRAVRRAGAQPGDLIFVSGRLGMSELGLRLLKARLRGLTEPASASDSKQEMEAIQAHLFPQPRCTLGLYLAEHRVASSMMDISDGLSSDLSRLLEASKVGARVREDLIPVPETLPRTKSLQLALHGGEDYELLFTVRPTRASRVPRRFQGVAIHGIGKIRRGRNLMLIGTGAKRSFLRPGGYDHFRKK